MAGRARYTALVERGDIIGMPTPVGIFQDTSLARIKKQAMELRAYYESHGIKIVQVRIESWSPATESSREVYRKQYHGYRNPVDPASITHGVLLGVAAELLAAGIVRGHGRLMGGLSSRTRRPSTRVIRRSVRKYTRRSAHTARRKRP